MAEARSTQRRRLLKRGAFFLGGALGLGLTGKAGLDAAGSQGASVGGALSMKVHGAGWRLTYPDRRRGVVPQPGDRSSSFGQLFTAPAGDKIGEFYASSFQFGSPFGASDVAASAMETHQFNFRDGSIIGIGTLCDLCGSQSVHAIIGGTGRYEGASGSYTARQNPIELGGDGTAEFEFNMILRSA